MFNLIFDLEIKKDGKKEKKYKDLEQYNEIILKTIEETQELNARIYIQVLDNLVEWIEKNQEINDDVLRCLILVNVNFILFHTILIRRQSRNSDSSLVYGIKKLLDEKFMYFEINGSENRIFREIDNFNKYLMELKNNYDKSDEKIRINNQFIKDNINLFKSEYFANKLRISKNVDDKIFQKINNFIETGILINE